MQLDRWSDTDGSDSGRKQLQIIVPPGQQELGLRLITAMYADQPDLSDLSIQQLVQLMLLADSYDVGKVLAAAARALGQLQPEQITLEVVSRVFALPESCLKLKCFEAARTKAAEQLQQQFGDLEEVWGDSSQAEQLLQLPFAAMLQLVQDGRTKVASEDTVMYTLERWLGENPDTSSEQQQQLADTVRLPLCTATFLSSAKRVAWLLDAGYTQQELLMACVLQGYIRLQEENTWVLECRQQRAAWDMKKRPSSSRSSASRAWTVPLAEVRSMVEKVTTDGLRRACMPRPPCIWQGREFTLTLTYDDGDDSIGLYLGLCNATSAATCCTFKALQIEGRSREHTMTGRLVGAYIHGWLSFVPVPDAAKDWAVVEAALRRERLVHDDGCLHLEATIRYIE